MALMAVSQALAQEDRHQDRPSAFPGLAAPYDFEASFVYPGLIAAPDSQAELEIALANLGYRGDAFEIEVIEAPEGWETEVRRFNTVLTKLWLPAEETATLVLSAVPPDRSETLPLGEHALAVRITSTSGGKSVECRAKLVVKDSQAVREPLTIATAYPEIGGPSDGRFAFSLDIRNNGREDALVNLLAEVPQGWDASFKPGYEDKQISSIHVPKGQNRSVTLDLTPVFQAPPGSYQVVAKAEMPAGSARTELTVNLSGTYKIRALTANELLSTTAEAARPVTLTLFVVNDGSAPQSEISFLAVKPDNWKVEFQPEKIPSLPARSNPVEVAMTITPAANALVGDYALGVSVQGERTQAAMDFRVTVKAGSGMAWLGAALVALVVLGLAVAFRRLGRR
jgi:uncharacterized membrane protein